MCGEFYRAVFGEVVGGEGVNGERAGGYRMRPFAPVADQQVGGLMPSPQAQCFGLSATAFLTVSRKPAISDCRTSLDLPMT